MIGRRQEINLQITQLIDVVLLVLALWLSYYLRASVAPMIWPEARSIPTVDHFYWLMALIGPFGPIALESSGFYHNLSRKSVSKAMGQIIRAAGIMGLSIAFFMVFFRWKVESRSVMLIASILAPLFLLFRLKCMQKTIFKQWLFIPEDKERVLFVGHASSVEDFRHHITPEQHVEFEVVGVYNIASYTNESFIAMLHKHAVSRVVFLVKHLDFEKIEEAVQACETEGVEAWLSANFFQTAIARPSFDVLGGRLMLVFHTTPHPSWGIFIKNVMDRVGALLVILLSSPLWIVAILGIKLSSRGPIFFQQDRAGRYGKPFKMLKFRTMVTDAEEQRLRLEASNEMEGPVFKMKHDPRIFPFGRWLRRLSIDELPQLLNVVQGDMSLVGPRPLPVYEIQRIEKTAQRRRLSMKPGLTCLWQVGGRNKITSFDEWVALDLKYIDNWSLFLDCKILIKTVPAVLKGSGAS